MSGIWRQSPAVPRNRAIRTPLLDAHRERMPDGLTRRADVSQRSAMTRAVASGLTPLNSTRDRLIGDHSCIRIHFAHPFRHPSTTSGNAHDRPLLLDHAERPQDHDVPRRDRAEIQDLPGQHRQGRSVQAGVPGDRAEQPHSRDGRSRAEGRRQADLDVRIRRDAAVSGGEDRKVPARRSLRPLRRDPVDVLADGRARADGRAEPSLQQLRRRTKSNTPSTAM